MARTLGAGVSSWAYVVVVVVFVFFGGLLGNGSLRRMNEQDFGNWEDGDE